MKSVVRSGMNSRCVWVPCMKPLPQRPPEPMAIMPWMMWKPLPSGSLDGSSSVHTRWRWYSCSTCQSTPGWHHCGSMMISVTMPTAASSTGGMISFQLRPAKKITARPEANTSRVVPRSGCLRISAAGTASSRPATTKSSGLSTPSRRWNHQASISGMATFISSLGWITMPTLIQRVAPFLVMPNSSTPSSSNTPTTYRGTASDSSRCGGTCATTNSTLAASSMLRAWVTKRVP